MEASISDLYYYPIKGLTAQRLPSVELRVAEGFPNDRVFGFARHDSGFDPEDPKPLPKDRFLVLLREERLAGLKTYLDPSTRLFSVHVQGNVVFEGDLNTVEGVNAAVDFLSGMFDLEKDRRLIFANSGQHRFTDVSVISDSLMNSISLINLASVRELGMKIGKEVDPLRFRANIYFDGWPPFEELEHVGREISIGKAHLRIVRRTQRCAATEVNPSTALRDIAVPRRLMEHFGHADLGVYAEVIRSGTIRPGDEVRYIGGTP